MKKLIAIAAIFASLAANACWYYFYQYEDFIKGINNFQRHANAEIVTWNDHGQPVRTTQYSVENNLVVDFPITVSVKLVSDTPIFIGAVTETNKAELLECALQYRVLPNGKWVTVEHYTTPTGTIGIDTATDFYLGQNNIAPKCKKGDVIMIRLYVTDGIWQSGPLEEDCSRMLGVGQSEKFPDKYTLPDFFTYNLYSKTLSDVDLGGRWLPHLVTTVIWSGETRTSR